MCVKVSFYNKTIRCYPTLSAALASMRRAFWSDERESWHVRPTSSLLEQEVLFVDPQGTFCAVLWREGVL